MTSAPLANQNNPPNLFNKGVLTANNTSIVPPPKNIKKCKIVAFLRLQRSKPNKTKTTAETIMTNCKSDMRESRKHKIEYNLQGYFFL